MQVARSAVGKVGMCPTCGRKMRIAENNTQPLASPGRESAGGKRPFWRNARWGGRDPESREEAKRLFGEAADLFCAGQYGKAMAIFDELVRRFPGNPDIENARAQCMEARMRAPLGLPQPGQASNPSMGREALREAVLSKLVDKLHNGTTDVAQLQAADLLGKMLGFFPNGSPRAAKKQEKPKAPEGDEPHEDAEEAPDTPDEALDVMAEESSRSDG